MTARLLVLLALGTGCAPKTPPAAPVDGSAAPSDAWGAPASGSEPPAPGASPSASPSAAPAAGSPATGSTWGEAAPSASTSKLPTSAQRQLDDAAALLVVGDEGRAKAALEKLESLSREHPDAPEVFYDLGLAHEILGDSGAARRAWSRATELDPTFARAWLNLGVLSARAGKMDMALATFQTGTRYNANDIELRVATVAAFRAMKRPDDAVAAAKAALAINSRALGIYTNLALVYLDTDRTDLARFILEKALVDIKDAGSDPLLHAALGIVYGRLGYVGDSLAEHKKALELDPYQLEALQALGRWYLDNRAWADAAPLWERVVELTPSEVAGRINLGIAYRGLARFDDTKRTYEECLRIDPRNPEPYRNLAVLYGDYLKDYDTALTMIDRYRSAGGGPAAELDKWVDSLKKEKARKQKAEERKRQEEDRKRLEETRRLAEEQKKEEAPAPTPAPEAPAPPPAPEEPVPAPASPTDPSPWGG